MGRYVTKGTVSRGLYERVTQYVRDHYKISMERLAVMLPTFIAVLKGHMENVEKAVAGGELSSIVESSHALRGSLLNLGLIEIAGIAGRMESAAREGDAPVDFDELLGMLQERLAEIM